MSDSTDTIIRPAAAGDEDDIYRVHTGALLSAGEQLDKFPFLEPAYYTPMIEAGRALVAAIDGRLVGFGELVGHEIRSVYVDPDRQRRGVGEKLLGALEAFARREGLTWSNIRCRRGLADSYYARHGWAPADPSAYRMTAETDWVDIVKEI